MWDSVCGILASEIDLDEFDRLAVQAWIFGAPYSEIQLIP